MRYFKTPINRKIYRQISAFIMPKPCGFSTQRTRMPTGILRSDIHVWQQPYVCATSTGATVDVGHALQRRDSGRHHLRLISVSLSNRAQGMFESPQSTQRAQKIVIPVTSYEKAAASRLRTRMTRRDKKGVSQIAEYATPSIWGNPTVTCIGSNADVWSLLDNMEMLEVLSNQSVRIKYHEENES